MNIKKLIKRNVKTLKKGVIKAGGKKIDIKPLIDSSAEDATIVSSIDKIIPVVTDRKSDDGLILQTSVTAIKKNGNYKRVLDNLLTNPLNLVLEKSSQNITVVLMKPLDKIKDFYFDSNDLEGALMRQSTLSHVLKKVMLKWKNTIYNTAIDATAVMFLPDIVVFLNSNGDIIKPSTLNVLYVGLPANVKNDNSTSAGEIIKANILTNMMDVFDVAINLGLTKITFNPYTTKYSRKHPDIVSDGLVRIVTSKKVRDNFESINLEFDDDDLCIMFCNAQKNHVDNSSDISMEDYKEYLNHKRKDEEDENDEEVTHISIDEDYHDEEDEEDTISETDKAVEKRKVLNDLKEASEED